MAKQEDVFKKVVSHAKEYGFIFPSSEIYDGLSAVYDYGQNGAELKNNIKQYWWKAMVQLNENIVGLDSAILMHPTTWKASGHVDAFNDPLIDNKDSKKRFRADVLIEDYCAKLEDKAQKEIEKAAKNAYLVDEKGLSIEQKPEYLVSNLEEIKMSLIASATQNAHSRANEFAKVGDQIMFAGDIAIENIRHVGNKEDRGDIIVPAGKPGIEG